MGITLPFRPFRPAAAVWTAGCILLFLQSIFLYFAPFNIFMMMGSKPQLETRQLRVPELPDVAVLGGKKDRLSLTTNAVSVSLLPEDFDRISCEIELTPSVFAPIKANEPVGSVIYRLGDKVLSRAEIFAAHSVDNEKSTVNKDYIYWIRQLLGAK